MAELDRALTVMDQRLRNVLVEAALALAGGRLDKHAHAIVQAIVPASHAARQVGKRLPVGVFPLVAEAPGVGPLTAAGVGALTAPGVGALTAAGEIKTWRRGRRAITATAREVAAAATSRAVPFFVLAGKGPSRMWLLDLVDEIDRSAAGALWPAAFSYDLGVGVSILRVTPESALRVKAGGEFLDGLVTIDCSGLDPLAVLYFWLWAAIYAERPVHGMNFRLMRDAVGDLCETSGVVASFRTAADGIVRDQRADDIRLVLPEGWLRRPAPDRAPDPAEAPPPDDVQGQRGRRVMLITLSAWVDEEDCWDESPWGGPAHATRPGYGYRPGMSDAELLDAARLFWKWTPESPTWSGIEYAVVAHEGVTRAVLRIDRPIGPFWGRWGFQGRVVDDPALKAELVGRAVPRRPNPITSITL